MISENRAIRQIFKMLFFTYDSYTFAFIWRNRSNSACIQLLSCWVIITENAIYNIDRTVKCYTVKCLCAIKLKVYKCKSYNKMLFYLCFE